MTLLFLKVSHTCLYFYFQSTFLPRSRTVSTPSSKLQHSLCICSINVMSISLWDVPVSEWIAASAQVSFWGISHFVFTLQALILQWILNTLVSSLKMSRHINCWGRIVQRTTGPSPQRTLLEHLEEFFLFCFGNILEVFLWWRLSRCLFLRMAGCTSRCRQGVLKLIQSLQRLVSGTLAKGTLSPECALHDYCKHSVRISPSSSCIRVSLHRKTAEEHEEQWD